MSICFIGDHTVEEENQTCFPKGYSMMDHTCVVYALTEIALMKYVSIGMELQHSQKIVNSETS